MQSINKYYLVGIKGTGMSSLAKLLKEEGNEVLGSDVDEYYFTEDTLKEQEIEIKSFNRSNITKDYFYIIGNAFNKSNIEVDDNLKNAPYIHRLLKPINLYQNFHPHHHQ